MRCWTFPGNTQDQKIIRTVVTLPPSADGRVAQRSTATAGQKTILTALELPEPPKYLEFTAATS